MGVRRALFPYLPGLPPTTFFGKFLPKSRLIPASPNSIAIFGAMRYNGPNGM